MYIHYCTYSIIKFLISLNRISIIKEEKNNEQITVAMLLAQSVDRGNWLSTQLNRQLIN